MSAYKVAMGRTWSISLSLIKSFKTSPNPGAMTTVENYWLANFYETIIENAESNILILNEDFSIVSLNPGFHWIFLETYEVQLKKGGNFFEVMEPVAPTLAARWKIRCRAALKGLSISDEERFESHGQTYSWKIYYRSVRLGNQRFVSIYSRNISAVKVFQDKIRQQEANLRSILNALSSNIWFVNQRFEVVDFNDSTFTFFLNTYNLPLIPGRNFVEMLPESMETLRQRWLDRLTHVLFTKTKTSHLERMSMNGEDVVHETKITPVLEGEEVVGLAISVDDVTIREAQEQKQRDQLQEMQKLGKEIDNFLYGVSHDLRGPLSSIVGLINIIRRDTVNDIALLDHIETSVKRLDTFVANIIAYSRDQKVGIAIQEIDLDNTISSVIAALNYPEKFKWLDFKYQIKQDAAFFSDQNRLATILLNTLFTVFHSLDVTRKITIALTVEVTTEGALLELEDVTEHAPTAAHNNRIFESFFQGADVTTGSGLALSLVKNTLEKLGGIIVLTSTRGFGNGVILKIPNQFFTA